MFGYDWPRLHAALNDLPVALLLAAVLLDLLAVVTKRQSFRVVGAGPCWLGAVGGAAAVLSGLQAEEHISHGEAVHRVMETHEKLGLITLGVFGVLALWRIVRERRMGAGERALSLALSIGGVGLLFATGLYGGKLVFEHAAGIPTEVLQEELQERAKDHHHRAGDEHPAVAPDSSACRPAGARITSISPELRRTRTPPAPRRTRTDRASSLRLVWFTVVALQRASRTPPVRLFLRCRRRRAARSACPVPKPHGDWRKP